MRGQRNNLWEHPGAVACALTVAARNSAREATGGLRGTELGRTMDAAKVMLEEATVRERELLAGSDPVCCAFARMVLSGTAVRRVEEAQVARELEDAYAEGREDEIEGRELVGRRLLAEIQVDLGHIVDTTVVADVLELGFRFRDERDQRRLLAAVA